MFARVEIDLECQACSRNETRYNLAEESDILRHVNVM